MSEKPIKVVMLCHLSNNDINSRLPLRLSFKDVIVNCISRKPLTTEVNDFAIWNTNAIKEFEKLVDQVELHVISPYAYLRDSVYEYKANGIYYHFYRNDDAFNEFLQRNIIKKLKLQFKRERQKVAGFIEKIKPDIVQLVGAENPCYSICALDVPHSIPLIVQLQTLLSDPEFEHNYTIGHDYYLYRSGLEQKILLRADMIATRVDHFINIIRSCFIPDARFVDMVLPLSEEVSFVETEKKFDFVYFAIDISKAADVAVEAFIAASRKHPGITMDIVGGYKTDYFEQLENRLNEAGLRDMVTFEGKLQSHEDVINQIRFSRFAVLPLKIDVISGTVRESLANGIPVVTTVTPATPKLNTKRECVLLSAKGDIQSMADNMCLLLENSQLAETLRDNGRLYSMERVSNESHVKHWIECYRKIINEACSKIC